MKLSEKELKELYQQHTARCAARPRGCPDEELLVNAALKRLTNREREELVDHLAACSDCAQEYRLINSIKLAPQPIAAEYGQPAVNSRSAGSVARCLAILRDFSERLLWSARWRVAAVALIMLIAAGASLMIWRAERFEDEAISNVRGNAAIMMQVEPPDRAVLVETPASFSWSKVESAVNYKIVVYDIESTPIWESAATTETTISLPEKVRNELPKGGQIYWRVFIFGSDGELRSELFQFTISAP